ncbi:hypothetical protein D9C73_005283 [Collichthys lucidus]|uniref:Uncharacterized protein n=1 Tax=Collichthys lucidus TaxID=240159 RepID=A0A4U5UA26_COLLU|nr:hypothetical protein D9C73_005283 [Collichthys lucidus]
MFAHLHASQVHGSTGGGLVVVVVVVVVGGGGREEGEGHYPLEGGAKGEVKRTDETFEAHIDMLLSMDGVLEGAAVLCVCKLACSLLFLPSLAASHSPVSFCCCCLLIFTDFLVAVFLSFLCIFESWLTELTQLGDVIALRFLLFLSHTYGVVLLLTTPLIAVETLSRLLWPHSAVAYRAVSQRVTNSNAQRCYIRMETVDEEEADGDNPDKDIKKRLSYVVSYLCCLSVWVVVALNVRWRWELEEVWAAVCLHKTNSLIRCLPNLFSPMSSTVNPCWVMAFLSLLLILLTMSMGLQRRQQAGAQMDYRDSAGAVYQIFSYICSKRKQHVHPS